jgi:hypothetical protein
VSLRVNRRNSNPHLLQLVDGKWSDKERKKERKKKKKERVDILLNKSEGKQRLGYI